MMNIKYRLQISQTKDTANMKEISIKDIENIKIGNAENKKAATGCTVILWKRVLMPDLTCRAEGRLPENQSY